MSADFEAEVREFAAWHDTTTARQLVAHCEAGRITWRDAHALCVRALDAGMRAIAESELSGGAA